MGSASSRGPFPIVKPALTDSKTLEDRPGKADNTHMSRKDYIAIAAVIGTRMSEHTSPSPIDAAARIVLRDITNDLSLIFKADNPRFDADRFKSAARYF